MRSLGKRVAKELKVSRHIPEHRVYELKVTWQGQTISSTFYLPEVFLYPYSLVPQDHSQTQKAVNCIIEPKVDLNITRATTNHVDNSVKTHLQMSVTPQSSSEILPFSLHENALILDYDALAASQQMRPHLQRRNKEIVLQRQYREVKKKRKL